jgi:signal transduction histidine kinase/CheY-like chemotaxis protein/HPt (histidine-containing phosphotransfer) domain-containing protein
MDPRLTDILSLLMLLGALSAVYVAGLAWSASRSGPAKFFALAMASIFVWSFFSYLRFRVPVPRDMLVYHRCILIGVSSLPYWFLLFVHSFAGRPMRKRAMVLLSIPHLLAIAFAWGLPPGTFFWTLTTTETSLIVERGAVYWLFILYIVIVSLLALAFLLVFTLRTRGIMRKVLLAMAVLLFVPLVIGVLSSLDIAFSSDYFDLSRFSLAFSHPRAIQPPELKPLLGGGLPGAPPGGPGPGGPATSLSFDPTSVAFALSGLIIGLILRRFNFLDNLPFAKNLVFDAIKDPIVAVDVDGLVIGANTAAQKLFPTLSPSGILRLSELCPEAAAIVRGGGHAEWASAGRRFEVAAHRLDDSSKKQAGAIVFFYDVTAYHDLLEALRSAREKADELAANKGRFLASMSHEIRTPLNAIIGLTELSLRTPLSAEQRENLAAVLDAGHRLLDLVNDILDLSKIEAQAMRLERADFDLPRSIGLVARTMRPIAEAKGLSFGLALDEGLPRAVRGDSLRLGQVLTNLISNAVKFTAEGGISISVSPIAPSASAASVASAPGRGAAAEGGRERSVGIRVTVRDTGIGIAREKQGLIFESFSQADDSTSRRYGGTGLGLPICRELVGLFGGELSVESAPGAGSAFTFTAFFEPGDPARLPVEAEAPVESASTGRLAILVVEDNPVNARVALHWLSQEGHEAVHASSGGAALEALAGKAFDLVLLDVELADMDGPEVARRIREGGAAGPSGRTVPIVAMTAHSVEEAREACMKAGMDDFVTKPVNFRDLAAVLSRTARQAARLAAQQAAPPAPAVPASVPGSAPAGSGQVSPQEALISREEPLRRLGGDADLYRELLAIFVSEEGLRSAALREAMARAEAGSLRRLAHSLRGSARTIGAEPLAAAAERLETAAARLGEASGQAGGRPGATSAASEGAAPEGAAAGAGVAADGQGSAGAAGPATALAALAALAEATLDLLSRTTRCASELLPPGYSPPVEE